MISGGDNYRYIRTQIESGRRFIYFRRPGCPIIRMHAELGTPEFDQLYRELMAASPAEFTALRLRAGMSAKPWKKHQPQKIDAIETWAKGMPLTPEQIVILRRTLRLTPEEIAAPRKRKQNQA